MGMAVDPKKAIACEAVGGSAYYRWKLGDDVAFVSSTGGVKRGVITRVAIHVTDNPQTMGRCITQITYTIQTGDKTKDLNPTEDVYEIFVRATLDEAWSLIPNRS